METPFFAFGMAKERITTAMVTRTRDNGDGITYTRIWLLHTCKWRSVSKVTYAVFLVMNLDFD